MQAIYVETQSTLTQLSISKKKTGFSSCSAMMRTILSVWGKERWVCSNWSPRTGLVPWHHVSGSVCRPDVGYIRADTPSMLSKTFTVLPRGTMGTRSVLSYLTLRAREIALRLAHLTTQANCKHILNLSVFSLTLLMPDSMSKSSGSDL